MSELLRNVGVGLVALWPVAVVLGVFVGLAYWYETRRLARLERDRDAIAIVCGLIVPQQRNRRGGRS